MNHREIDWDAIRERVAAARAEAERKAKPSDDTEPAPELDLSDLGARMHGRRYKGDPLAEATDRMFRH